MEKYMASAKKLKVESALILSPRDIIFDIRALLKCRWGCEDFFQESIRCHNRGISFEERKAMIKSYKHILLVHAHDARRLSQVLLKLERTAFLDGHYFAFAIRFCNLCRTCLVSLGKPCPTPEKVRPCDQSFGIDVYATVRRLGLPCHVLRTKTETQNRYGFLLID
jgi:predicted metal-binding protein